MNNHKQQQHLKTSTTFQQHKPHAKKFQDLFSSSGGVGTSPRSDYFRDRDLKTQGIFKTSWRSYEQVPDLLSVGTVDAGMVKLRRERVMNV